MPYSFKSFVLITMSAKSLGTLALIYAIVEVQNRFPRKTMLWKGDMKIFGRFNFRTRPYGPKILVSENCGDI